MKYENFEIEHKRNVEILYRGFSQKEHLDMFMAGKIRLVNYRYYRINPNDYLSDEEYFENFRSGHQDTRFNQEEGIARNIKYISKDGTERFLNSYGFATPHYILCFYKNLDVIKKMESKDQDAYKFRIKLKNPIEFHNRIMNFLNYDQRHHMGNMINPTDLILHEGQNNPEVVSIYSDTNATIKQEYRFSYYILEEKENCGVLISNSSKYIPNGKITAANDSKFEVPRLGPDFYVLESIKVDDICDII